jgi:branched-subunit amino acid aminotransferase/4-amino-4-deoxychorismate lyase
VSVEVAPVPFLSPAVQRGFGFFETALLAERRAVLWEPHLDRMQRILSSLDLPKPSKERLNAAARRVLDASPAKPGEQRALRLTWFAVGDDLDDEASFRLEAHLMPIPLSRLARRSGSHSVSLPLDLQRDTPGVKSTSYFAAMQGGRLAKKAGGDEGLFRSPDGHYLEGTTTGLAAWNGGAPVLAPKGALPSVTAAAFFGGAPASAPLTAEMLFQGALLLGSLTMATPLLTLDGTPCARPPEMLARVVEFNRRLLEDPLLGTEL